jgi:hypothetical protein
MRSTMETDYECWFNKPKTECILFTTVKPIKEKVMNTYTISAREVNVNHYEVEASCEEDAINDVEWGNVEPYDRDFEELLDIEVDEVRRGEQSYVADLTLSFNAVGVEEEQVRDMLWDLLASFDGQTTENNDGGTLESVGFNIVDMKES